MLPVNKKSVTIRDVGGQESGVALVLTLGILTLLILLCLSFALASRFAIRSAQLSEDQVRVHMLAESGLRKVLRDLSLEFSDNLNARNNFPATKPEQAFPAYLFPSQADITTPPPPSSASPIGATPWRWFTRL